MQTFIKLFWRKEGKCIWLEVSFISENNMFLCLIIQEIYQDMDSV